MKLSFENVVLDTDRFELTRDGRIEEIEPMVFNLLEHLLRNANQVFTRDQLIDSVWKGRIVSDSTVATCVKNARKALGDTGEQQRFIQTVRGRGYRFNAQVDQIDDQPLPPVQKSEAVDPAIADPVMLLMPFTPASSSDALRSIATGIVPALSVILTRIPLLRLTTDAARYSMQPPNTNDHQAHALRPDFVVEGSVHEHGDAASIVVQLLDGRSMFALWSETFSVDQPFAASLHGCIGNIAAKLEPQFYRAMFQAVGAEVDDLSAQQLFLKASSLLVLRGWNPDSFADANDLLDKSQRLDSSFALAPALQALLYGFGSRVGVSSDRHKDMETARSNAEKALNLDSMDSTVLGMVGCSLADIGELDRGEALLINALDLNPTNAQAMVALGGVRIAQFDFNDAIDKLSAGIAMSPMDSRLSVWGALLAAAYLMKGELDLSIQTATMACQRHDQTYLPRLTLAAAHLCKGNEDDARRALQDAKRIKPNLTLKQIAALVSEPMAEMLAKLD